MSEVIHVALRCSSKQMWHLLNLSISSGRPHKFQNVTLCCNRTFRRITQIWHFLSFLYKISIEKENKVRRNSSDWFWTQTLTIHLFTSPDARFNRQQCWHFHVKFSWLDFMCEYMCYKCELNFFSSWYRSGTSVKCVNWSWYHVAILTDFIVSYEKSQCRCDNWWISYIQILDYIWNSAI